MNTMTTYSGRKFDPMQMTPGDVYIEDIAHALSLLCRGGGQLTSTGLPVTGWVNAMRWDHRAVVHSALLP